MHCEYFILIKPSITFYWTLFAQLNLHSWLGYQEVTDETFKQNKLKINQEMPCCLLESEKQTKK